MPSGFEPIVLSLGPTELLLIFVVAVPFLILPVIALVWVFRMGKRQGAAEARRAASGAEVGRDNGRDS